MNSFENINGVQATSNSSNGMRNQQQQKNNLNNNSNESSVHGITIDSQDSGNGPKVQGQMPGHLQ
jgi:hypothetical protein